MCNLNPITVVNCIAVLPTFSEIIAKGVFLGSETLQKISLPPLLLTLEIFQSQKVKLFNNHVIIYFVFYFFFFFFFTKFGLILFFVVIN